MQGSVLTSIAALLLGAVAVASTAAAAQEVTVYTTREPGLFKPIAEAFTAKSGVKVNTVFVKDGLAERVASEGAGSPVDLLMTVDVGALVDLVAKGVTQKLDAPEVSAVPANLRDESDQWTALSLRARLVWSAKEPKLDAITYEDLADPKWKGKICMRSGQHPYNTALLAAYIAHHGEEKAETWASALKANLARKPGGGDRDVARDILGGLCQIGVGNSYYVGLMRSGSGGADQQKWGEGVDVVMARFAGAGTHVNASGAALAKNAPHAAEARKLVAFMLSPEGQKIYAEQNYEYPVIPGVATNPFIAALGPLQPDALKLSEIARHRQAASRIMDKVGFDR
jgi:iron(III) transport system substrate-binding protein